MEIVIICLAAFLTAILTFFSGFGLGTILAPVFAIFFPIDIAIALTGVVHFSNNLFKIALIGRNTDKAVLLRFGIPAILASFAGAWLLLKITVLPTIVEYELWGKTFEITAVKLIIALLLIIFSILEISPSFQKVQFGKDKLVWGGILSGFFGGLSGIQGAIRSAFLIKNSQLGKQGFHLSARKGVSFYFISNSGGTSNSSDTYFPFFFLCLTHSVKRYSICPFTERKSSSAQAASFS